MSSMRLVGRVVDVDQPVRERRGDVDVADPDPDALVVLDDQVRVERVLRRRWRRSRQLARQQPADGVVDADQVQGGRHAEPVHRDRRPAPTSRPGSCGAGTGRRRSTSAAAEATKCSPPAAARDVREDRDHEVPLVGHRWPATSVPRRGCRSSATSCSRTSAVQLELVVDAVRPGPGRHGTRHRAMSVQRALAGGAEQVDLLGGDHLHGLDARRAGWRSARAAFGSSPSTSRILSW